MRHRIVGELMTSAVVHVGPDTGFKEITRLLAEQRRIPPLHPGRSRVD